MRRFFFKKAQLLRHPRHNPFDYVVILSAQATLFPYQSQSQSRTIF